MASAALAMITAFSPYVGRSMGRPDTLDQRRLGLGRDRRRSADGGTWGEVRSRAERGRPAAFERLPDAARLRACRQESIDFGQGRRVRENRRMALAGDLHG